MPFFGWSDLAAPVAASEHTHRNLAEWHEFFAGALFVFAPGYALADLHHHCWRMHNTLRRQHAAAHAGFPDAARLGPSHRLSQQRLGLTAEYEGAVKRAIQHSERCRNAPARAHRVGG